MISRNVPNLFEIAPGLYQSAAPGSRNGPAVFELTTAGIDTVVDLWGGVPIDYPKHVSVVRWPFRDCAIGTLHSDDCIPEGLDDLAAFIASLVRRGRNVLVHCHMGHNRSGLVNALVLMQMSPGLPASNAIDLVRRGRGDAALNNLHFCSYLLELDDARADEQARQFNNAMSLMDGYPANVTVAQTPNGTLVLVGRD